MRKRVRCAIMRDRALPFGTTVPALYVIAEHIARGNLTCTRCPTSRSLIGIELTFVEVADESVRPKCRRS